MTRIKEVRYGRLKSLPDSYENVSAELVADVPDPDVWADAPTWEQVYADLQEKVNAKLDAEISKPLEFRKSKELKILEAEIESGMEVLKGLMAEVKVKRRELDRCIEVGMRSLFEEEREPFVGMSDDELEDLLDKLTKECSRRRGAPQS